MTLPQTIYEFTRLHPGSLSVLFVYLPLYLFGYYIVPARYRMPVLLLASLHFYYAVARSSYLAVMVGSVLLDFVCVQLMEHWDAKPAMRRLCMVFSTVKNLGLVIAFGLGAQLRVRPQTVGIQVYSLCALSCVRDAYRREIPYERDWVRFGLYCVFFPKLYAGPLLPYGDFVSQLEGIKLEPSRLVRGAGQFVHGIFKMWVLGGSLYTLYRDIAAIREATVLSAWVGVLSYALMLYYLLSGLGDIAQGIGEMFGIKLPKNFYYPYQSRNVGDFFLRFNLTVHGFISKLLQETLGWDKKPVGSAALLLATGMLSGLWFGLRWNYLLWGIYLALFLILERYVYPGLLAKAPVLFSRIGTLAVTLAGFTIFMGATPMESAALIRRMFAFGGPVVNDALLYLLASNWLLLAVSCLLATNGMDLLVRFFRKNAPRVSAAVLGLADAAIAVIYVALTL